MIGASVSVIIPCFNAERTIGRALDSVCAQTQPVLEVICVDDASTDSTLRVVEAYMAGHPNFSIRVLSHEKNFGPSATRNRGWDAATGDYIVFLDADDVWHPQKIELQYAWMQKYPQVDMSGHAYALASLDHQQDLKVRHIDYHAHTLGIQRLLFSNPFTPSAVMLKRRLSQRFEISKRYCEDHLLWLEMAFDGVSMALSPIVLVYKNLGTRTPSRDLWRMRQGDWDNYRRLWREGKLNGLVAGAVSIFSLIKFILHLMLGTRLHFAIKQRIEND